MDINKKKTGSAEVTEETFSIVEVEQLAGRSLNVKRSRRESLKTSQSKWAKKNEGKKTK